MQQGFSVFLFFISPALLFTLVFLFFLFFVDKDLNNFGPLVRAIQRDFRSPGKLVRVFDPDQPEKTFIMENGRVVEVTHRDGEQGGRSEMTGLVEATREATEEDVLVEDIKDRRDNEETGDDPDLETGKSQKDKEEEEGEADSGGNTDVAGETEEVKTGEN